MRRFVDYILFGSIFSLILLFIKDTKMNRKHGTNCRPNRNGVSKKDRQDEMPCGIPKGSMSKCWEPNCYLNYKCSIYKGKHINPPMNFIPMQIEDSSGIMVHPYGDDSEMWFDHCLKIDVV